MAPAPLKNLFDSSRHRINQIFTVLNDLGVPVPQLNYGFNQLLHGCADLAPCHTSKKVTKFFADNDIRVLEWPGNSPDLNPIENLWAIIKQRLRGKDCTTIEKLI